jgi:hypothetical protein
MWVDQYSRLTKLLAKFVTLDVIHPNAHFFLFCPQVMFLSPFRAPCASCGAFVSPQWRCGGTLCNACGIKLSRGRLQPTDHSATVAPMSNHTAVTGPPAAAAAAPSIQISSQQVHIVRRQPAKRNRACFQKDSGSRPAPSERDGPHTVPTSSADPTLKSCLASRPSQAPAGAVYLGAAKQEGSDLDTIAKQRSTRKRSLPKWYHQYESGEDGAEQEESEDSGFTEVSSRMEKQPCQGLSLLQRPMKPAFSIDLSVVVSA